MTIFGYLNTTPMPYLKQTSPFIVPTTDNKLIEEHYGLASTGDRDFSIARMIAPPHWGEPHQTPAFDEVTIVFRGSKQIEVDGELITLKAGESILVRKGSRVRYSNPFADPCEYWSCCVPAFSVAAVNRDGEEQDQWMDIE
jgi:mannose-6-phosphate isomerase-like protein (cupin superfamily)